MVDVERIGKKEVLARRFLETRNYEGPVFRDYAWREADQLARLPPEEWDTRWMERLQLLSVVLHDAEAWAKVTGRDPDKTQWSAFAPILERADRRRLSLVFATYAMTDATAAYRLAAKCGVNMIDDHAEALVGNCRFPPFLSLALEELERDADHQRRWIEVLAESALRHRNVARELYATLASQQLARVLAESGAKLPWWPSLKREGTFADKEESRSAHTTAYTGRVSVSALCAIMTLALKTPEKDGGLRSVSVLRSLEAAHEPVAVRAARPGGGLLWAVGVAGVATLLVMPTEGPMLRIAAAAGVLAGSAAIGRIMWETPKVQADLYDFILGVRESALDVLAMRSPRRRIAIALSGWRRFAARPFFGQLMDVARVIGEERGVLGVGGRADVGGLRR
jgi:hypothetical protein